MAKQTELQAAHKVQEYNTHLCHMSSEEIKKHSREAVKYLTSVRAEIKTPASK
ncbi:hypothetical protein FACS1894166_01170 [Bacilli bacterium]|nr:hypothetical protein FACS1894166_01170 [Bacilli bacterium]